MKGSLVSTLVFSAIIFTTASAQARHSPLKKDSGGSGGGVSGQARTTEPNKTAALAKASAPTTARGVMHLEVLDYLKRSFGFSALDVPEQVRAGAVTEHILGGLLAPIGGHIWGPWITYQDAPEWSRSAMVLGIIAMAVGLAWTPLLSVVWVPWIGWIGVSFVILCVMAAGAAFNLWFMPRAIQLAYSDTYNKGPAAQPKGGGK